MAIVGRRRGLLGSRARTTLCSNAAPPLQSEPVRLRRGWADASGAIRRRDEAWEAAGSPASRTPPRALRRPPLCKAPSQQPNQTAHDVAAAVTRATGAAAKRCNTIAGQPSHGSSPAQQQGSGP